MIGRKEVAAHKLKAAAVTTVFKQAERRPDRPGPNQQIKVTHGAQIGPVIDGQIERRSLEQHDGDSGAVERRQQTLKLVHPAEITGRDSRAVMPELLHNVLRRVNAMSRHRFQNQTCQARPTGRFRELFPRRRRRRDFHLRSGTSPQPSRQLSVPDHTDSRDIRRLRLVKRLPPTRLSRATDDRRPPVVAPHHTSFESHR